MPRTLSVGKKSCLVVALAIASCGTEVEPSDTSELRGPESASAGRYVVTNLNGDPQLDDGVCNADCSLREALAAANSHPGADRITFAIRGSGRVIVLRDALLPHIVDPVLIDGANTVGRPTRVVLEGGQLPQDDPATDCLTSMYEAGDYFFGKPGHSSALLYIDGSAASGSTIRNLEFVISGNRPADIRALASDFQPYGGPGTPLVGELHDARAAGAVHVAGPCTGVSIVGSDGNQVAGSSFSGFLLGNAAIDLESGSGNVIERNLVVNANDGIEIDGGPDNVVAGNVVQCDLMIQSEGIGVFGPGNVIERNDVSGAALNISVSYGVGDNLIRDNFSHDGGVGVVLTTFCGSPNNGNQVLGNTITRTQNGIVASDIPVTGFWACPPDATAMSRNTFRHNRIHGLTPFVQLDDFQANGWPDLPTIPQGIDEGIAGMFDWPWADGPGAPAAFTRAPSLSRARVQWGALRVEGTLAGAPGTYDVELFANRSGAAEADRLLGHAVVTIGAGSGTAAFDVRLGALVRGGHVTATATACADPACDGLGGTSELSVPLPIL